MTSRSPDASDRGPDDQPPLVLIVDDSEQNLTLARDVLRAAGFRTLEAASGAEGIALADQHLPDVVLLDLRLPDMDGSDVARTLRGNVRTARLPVVALSALRLEAKGPWLLDAGFAGYLEKPITIGEFADEVLRYCARTGA